jgi:hypothetical protein
MSDIPEVVESTAPPTPAAAPVAAPEPESTAEQVPSPEGETPEAKPERTFTQKELDEVVQKRLAKESRRAERLAEARLRAEFAEKRVSELESRLNPPNPESGKPTPEQFKDYESYIDALTDWKVEQKVGGIRQETAQQQQQRVLAQAAQTIMPKLKAAQSKYDDFEEVATSFKAPRALQAAMLESDITGDLYYYLGANPEERERLFGLSEVGQVRAIAALEAKLKAPPKPTQTPAPIVPNSGNSKVTKHPTDMSYEEFAEYRAKRLKAKRR